MRSLAGSSSRGRLSRALAHRPRRSQYHESIAPPSVEHEFPKVSHDAQNAGRSGGVGLRSAWHNPRGFKYFASVDH